MEKMPHQRQTSRLQNGQVKGTCGELTKDKFSAEKLSKKGILCHAKEHSLHSTGGEALWHGFEPESLMSDI